MTAIIIKKMNIFDPFFSLFEEIHELIVRKIKFKLFKTLDDKIEKIETFALETAAFIEIWQHFIHDYKVFLEKLPEKKNKTAANLLIFNSEQAKGILQHFYEVYSYFFLSET